MMTEQLRNLQLMKMQHNTRLYACWTRNISGRGTLNTSLDKFRYEYVPQITFDFSLTDSFHSG